MKKKNKIILVISMVAVLLITTLVPTFAHTVSINGENYEVDNNWSSNLGVTPNSYSYTNSIRMTYTGNNLKNGYWLDGKPHAYFYNENTATNLTSALDIQAICDLSKLNSSVSFDITFGDIYNSGGTMASESYKTEYLFDFLSSCRVYAVGNAGNYELFRFIKQGGNIVYGVFDTYGGLTYTDEYSGYTITPGLTDLHIMGEIKTMAETGYAYITIGIKARSVNRPSEYDLLHNMSFQIPITDLIDDVSNSRTIALRFQASKNTVIPSGFKIYSSGFASYDYYMESAEPQINNLLKDFYEKGLVEGREDYEDIYKDYNILLNSQQNSEAIPKLFNGIFDSVSTGFNTVLEYEAFGLSIKEVIAIVAGILILSFLSKLFISKG